MVLDHVVCILNDTRLQWTLGYTSIYPHIYQLYDGFECIYVFVGNKLEFLYQFLFLYGERNIRVAE